MKITITNLEQLRKVKGISYKQIDKTMSRATYSNIINGKIFATEKSIEKLSKIFDVEESEIKNLLLNEKSI